MLNSGPPSVTCPVLTVTNADFANCNGDYSVTEERVTWAADRPVYAHADKDRYLSHLCCVHLSDCTYDRFIFWNAGGLGWSIGKREYLTSGSHWHRSMCSRYPVQLCCDSLCLQVGWIVGSHGRGSGRMG